MGIRFECPNGHPLNVKSFLAGKRGICPECDARFIVPSEGGKAEAVVEPPSDLPATAAQPVAAAPAVAEPPTPPPPPAAPAPPPLPEQPVAVPDVWYVRTATGDQYGPANSETLNAWVAGGRVPSGSLVWRTGWPEWKPSEEALAELDVSPEPPGVAELETVTEPQPTDNYRARQRRRRERARRVTLSLSAVVFLLLVVLIVVLVRG